jgi:hypothetical protein
MDRAHRAECFRCYICVLIATGARNRWQPGFHIPSALNPHERSLKVTQIHPNRWQQWTELTELNVISPTLVL